MPEDQGTRLSDGEICPSCGKGTVQQICVSFSYDSGYSQWEFQCPACGAAWNESREPEPDPSLWDWTGSMTAEPSPVGRRAGTPGGVYWNHADGMFVRDEEVSD